MTLNQYDIIYAKDNSSIKDQLLSKNIDLNMLYFPPSGDPQNLGLHKYKNDYYTSNFVGVCRLKKINGENLKNSEGKEVILKVEPRFSVTLVEILNYIRTDDEFDRYLAPQTNQLNHKERDIESLNQNELFYFFENEAPLKVESGLAKDSSIITVNLFLSMLKELCRKPLMGRMIKKEENLTGKVKGKILFSKNIQKNLVRGRKERIYCQHLHYSQDIIENQILKSALLKAKNFVFQFFKDFKIEGSSFHEAITFCIKSLDHISLKNVNAKDIEGLKFGGFYSHYRPVINLAKMVLNEISIESNGFAGISNLVVPYAISMEKLFEMYVRTYLKQNGFYSYKIETDSGIQLLKYDEKKSIFEKSNRTNNEKLANYIGGNIKPDLIFKKNNTGEIVIFDVKYKFYNNRQNVRDDRLQILAYALMYNCSHVGLIFPMLEGENAEFKPQIIQTMDDKEILYHQLIVNLNATNDNYEKKETVDIAKYIQTLMMD